VTLTARSTSGGDEASVTITIVVEKKEGDGGFDIPGYTYAALLAAILIAVLITGYVRRKD
jgi:hypothetical protein